jgi:D-galactose 1-dehydrogenase
MKINLGIIGLGNIYEFQKRALETTVSINIAAICDTDEHKAYSEAKKLNVEYYTDYNQLLKNPKIDAVLLSTPVLTHHEIGINVLKAKKHLLIEKPAAINLQQLHHMQDTAISNGVLLITAYHAAFARDLLWFKDMHEEFTEKLGPITGIDCKFFDPYIINGELDSKAISLAGSWIDSGINALSVVLQIIKPHSIKLKDNHLINDNSYASPNIGADVVFEATVNKEKFDINIKTDWTMNKNLKVTIIYFDKTNHKIILHHSNQQVIMVDNLKQESVIADFSSLDERLIAHYKGVFNDFINKLQSNRDNFEFTLKTHTLLLKTY